VRLSGPLGENRAFAKARSRNVVKFPKLPEFQQVTLKVLRWEERDKRLVIKDAEVVA
jgi:hypothetical protein